MRTRIQKFLNKLPYIRGLHKQISNCKFPNGHFYSPVYSLDDLKLRESEIFKNNFKDNINGIDLNIEIQINLLNSFVDSYNKLPYLGENNKNMRYYFLNDYYSYTDSITLFGMILKFRPSKIIEIGSGFSSAVMLDTNELFFDNKILLTFIDPYIHRLTSLLKNDDVNNCSIIKNRIQVVALEEFSKLKTNDILFVDTTHVCKTGSDLNFILFEILPILSSGVIIHFHDIFYPFEYPKEWIYEGYNWNEDYLLKSFLMYNNSFEILFFADYMHKFHSELFKTMPLTLKNTGANLWIRKK